MPFITAKVNVPVSKEQELDIKTRMGKDHRSSYPLCIAYKAAQIVAPDKAERYLLRLRRATIMETKQTTKIHELAAIAIEAGIPEADFQNALEDGSAKEAFVKDLEFTKSLGIVSLPTCLIQTGSKKALVNGMLDYRSFVAAIEKLTCQVSPDA